MKNNVIHKTSTWSKQLLRWLPLLFLVLAAQTALAQSKEVTGVVSDALGPVIGASVLEKGTTNGVITDLDGNFKLTVSNDQAILQISYVGYITQEISTKGKTTFRITLKEEVLRDLV